MRPLCRTLCIAALLSAGIRKCISSWMMWGSQRRKNHKAWSTVPSKTFIHPDSLRFCWVWGRHLLWRLESCLWRKNKSWWENRENESDSLHESNAIICVPTVLSNNDIWSSIVRAGRSAISHKVSKATIWRRWAKNVQAPPQSANPSTSTRTREPGWKEPLRWTINGLYGHWARREISQTLVSAQKHSWHQAANGPNEEDSGQSFVYFGDSLQVQANKPKEKCG